MIRKTGRKSKSYLFTVDLNDMDDIFALVDIRVKMKVRVKYRKPELPYYPNGNMYGYGGTVKLSQNPQEADVYLKGRLLTEQEWQELIRWINGGR